MLTPSAALLLLCIIGIVIAATQIVKESRIKEAENAERGRRRVVQEDIDIDAAGEWLKVTPACPDCKTTDGRRVDSEGRIVLIQDGMDVQYNYCDDSFKWHAAHCKTGTYGGTPQREALIQIGQRLRVGK